jgi:hypothetical protein
MEAEVAKRCLRQGVLNLSHITDLNQTLTTTVVVVAAVAPFIKPYHDHQGLVFARGEKPRPGREVTALFLKLSC